MRLSGTLTKDVRLADVSTIFARLALACQRSPPILAEEERSLIGLLDRFSKPNCIGSWDWGAYLTAAVGLPIWPRHGSMVSAPTFAAMSSRHATRYKKVQDWETLSGLLRSGTVCGNCLSSIPYNEALPVHWFRLKCLPTTVCYRCMVSSRKMATVFDFFCPDRDEIHAISFDPDHDGEEHRAPFVTHAQLAAQKVIRCTAEGCDGNLMLHTVRANGEALALASCSNPIHRSVFSVYRGQPAPVVCPEEVRDFQRGYNPAAPIGGDDRLAAWRRNPSGMREQALRWLVQRKPRQRVKVQSSRKRQKKK